MNAGLLSRIPLLPVVALWLAYALLGWYLSAYHIFWFVGACVAALGLALSWKSIAALEQMMKFASQGLLLIVAMLLVCVLVALAAARSILIPIIVIPLAITFLANVEMRFAGFSKFNTFLFLAIVASVGLGFGEIIDLLFLASNHKY
jgi:hypothetical protein